MIVDLYCILKEDNSTYNYSFHIRFNMFLISEEGSDTEQDFFYSSQDLFSTSDRYRLPHIGFNLVFYILHLNDLLKGVSEYHPLEPPSMINF